MSTKSQEKFEAVIVERMSRAKSLADQIFGERTNVTAVEEITHYLEVAGDDEEDFLSDLGRMVSHTKVIYGTETPTPEQVFGVFANIFETEED